MSRRARPAEGLEWDDIKDIPGITHRKFDFWCSRGYVRFATDTKRSAGSGSWRVISEDEAEYVRVLVELADAGLRPEKAARLAREIQKRGVGSLGTFCVTR